MFLHLCLQNNSPDFTPKAKRVPKSPPRGQHYHELQASHHEPAAASITQVGSLGFQKYPHTPHTFGCKVFTRPSRISGDLKQEAITSKLKMDSSKENIKLKAWLHLVHPGPSVVSNILHLTTNPHGSMKHHVLLSASSTSWTRTPDGATQLSKFCCSTTSGENVNLMDFADSNQSCFYKRSISGLEMSQALLECFNETALHNFPRKCWC